MHAIQGVASLLVQPSRTEHPSEFTYGCGCFDSLSDGSVSTPAMCSPTSCDATVRLISDGFCPGRQLFFAAFRSSRHWHATRVQCARGCESIEPAWTPPDAYLVPPWWPCGASIGTQRRRRKDFRTFCSRTEGEDEMSLGATNHIARTANVPKPLVRNAPPRG
jgi:hypothetical protein